MHASGKFVLTPPLSFIFPQLAADSRLVTSSQDSSCPCYVHVVQSPRCCGIPDTILPAWNPPGLSVWLAQELRLVVCHPRTGKAWPLQHRQFWFDRGGTQRLSLAATLEEGPCGRSAVHAATSDRPEPVSAPIPGAYLPRLALASTLRPAHRWPFELISTLQWDTALCLRTMRPYASHACKIAYSSTAAARLFEDIQVLHAPL